MTQIHHITQNQSQEYIDIQINPSDLDFTAAKQIAKDKAFEICDHPMILSWKNGKTGQSHPDYECGINDRPFWIRYAQGRGANLTIDINKGESVMSG
ncbi:MAG: AF1514 family protein [Desulfobacter sp.]|nr:MAG: AF1514 family protein [Desulfobacter sp.]